jgi:protein involved in polysaccharide export with SLBB domain
MNIRTAVCCASLALALSGCASNSTLSSCDTSQPLATQYALGPGDVILVTVFRHEDLSGEFTIDDRGAVAIPLAGVVDASGLTTRELEVVLADHLTSQGYLVNPQITVAPVVLRPFYILGEVANPGEYEYRGSMLLLNAAALAGGFGYRAKQSGVRIERTLPDGSRCVVYGDTVTVILPGDVIHVPERFF